MTDHDTIFKELISTYFLEFIQIFAPDILDYMDMNSLVSLDKEVTDRLIKQRPKQADLVMRATFSQPVVKRPRRRKSKTAFFLIHI